MHAFTPKQAAAPQAGPVAWAPACFRRQAWSCLRKRAAALAPVACSQERENLVRGSSIGAAGRWGTPRGRALTWVERNLPRCCLLKTLLARCYGALRGDGGRRNPTGEPASARRMHTAQ
jgi:hypothetical protein